MVMMWEPFSTHRKTAKTNSKKTSRKIIKPVQKFTTLVMSWNQGIWFCKDGRKTILGWGIIKSDTNMMKTAKTVTTFEKWNGKRGRYDIPEDSFFL